MAFRTLSKNALAAVVQVVLSAGLLFELYRFLMRRLEPQEIGVWSLVMASTTVARLSEFGLGGGVVKFVAGDVGAGDPASAARTVWMSVVAIASAVCVGCVALTPFLHWLLPQLIKNPAMLAAAQQLLPYALLSMWLGAVANVFLSALDGVQRSDLRAVAMVSSAVVQISMAYWLLPQQGLGGMGFVQLAQAGTLLLVALVSSAMTLKQKPGAWMGWERARFMQVVRYGGGVQASAIGQILFEPTVKGLLTVFGGLTVTGFYEMANRAVTQFRAVIVSAYQMLVPYVAAKAGREALSDGQMRAAYLMSYRLLVVLATPYFALLGASLPVILTWWLGRYDSDFVYVGMICLLGWYLNTMTLPSYMLYLAAGRLKWTVWTHVTIGLLSVSLGGLGGVLWGGYGVLTCAMLSLVIGSGVVVVAYHLEYEVGVSELVPKSTGALLTGSFVGCVAVGLLILHWNGQGGLPTSIFVAFAAMLSLLGWLVCRHPILHDLVSRWRNDVHPAGPAVAGKQ